MAETTNIEWADATFNPWIGCTKVSAACDHCYAEVSTPARTMGVPWGAKQPRRLTSDANWAMPRHWNARAAEFNAINGRRQRVFCASLADVFDNEVSVQWRIRLVQLMLETPNLDWLLLTKRIGNAAEMLETAMRGYTAQREGWRDNVPPNVWIGATICNQEEADRDIPKLLQVPARLRFLSIEPMLGPIELGLSCENWSDDTVMDPETGAYECCKACGYTGIGNAIDWVICGGESGPHARPMHPNWPRSLRDQCDKAGVPFLFKQWGEFHHDFRTHPDWAAGKQSEKQYVQFSPANIYPIQEMVRSGKKRAGRMLDGRSHDEFPEAAR